MIHRLLYVIGQLGPGGSERQLYCLLKLMDRERYRPAVVVWNFNENDIYVSQIRSLGVPLYYLSTTLSITAKLRGIRRLVYQFFPEVVHSFTFYTNVAVSWATRRTGGLAVGSVRSDFLQARNESGLLLGALSARWPHDQICNNHSAAENMRSSKQFCPNRVYVVRNGVDLETFRPTELPPGSKARIIGIGSLLPVKRWDRVLRATLTLKQRGLDFLVRIIGDGPLRESLRQQAEILGVADRVQFSGYSDDVPSLLSGSTFLVHTSDSEGSPNAVMEAMASGRAVVATDAGDIPSLVDNCDTGFVTPRGDDEKLVERMATLIANRDLCLRMGEAGRAKAEREFGLDRLVSETLAAYKAAGWKDF